MPCRSRSVDRCPDCRMYRPLCLCDEIAVTRARLGQIKTEVCILMHWREEVLTTNTARLAASAIPGCEVRVRGRRGERLDLGDLVVGARRPLFLFPSDEAVELTPELVRQGSFRLIVPDGNWGQARRVAKREPALAKVTHVKLPPGAPSGYRLRASPTAESLCTLEAIARAMAILENRAEVGEALERIFRMKVERMLWGRGQIKEADCEFPVPPAAIEASYIAGARGSYLRT